MAITFIKQLLDRLRNDIFPGNHPFGLFIAASGIIATANHIYHYTLDTLSGLFTGTLFILLEKDLHQLGSSGGTTGRIVISPIIRLLALETTRSMFFSVIFSPTFGIRLTRFRKKPPTVS